MLDKRGYQPADAAGPPPPKPHAGNPRGYQPIGAIKPCPPPGAAECICRSPGCRACGDNGPDWPVRGWIACSFVVLALVAWGLFR